MTFFYLPFPLTQSTELEEGETFGVNANDHEPPLRKSCVDVAVAVPPSVNRISPSLFDIFCTFPS